MRAEEVASKTVDEARVYIAASTAVGEHLADQLLLPMALGQGDRSRPTSSPNISRSNASIIETFTPKRVTIDALAEGFAVRMR